MAPEQHTPASPSEDKATPNGEGQAPIRILHLEDQPSDAHLIRLAIEQAEDSLPVSIQLVRDKASYLAALHARCSDVILCDYRLPGYDGEEALKAAQDFCPEVPVIMVTGEMGEERAIETLKAGATDYVLKDGLKRLVPSIRRALREAQLERERYESEEKYRVVAENSPDGIFINQGGVVRYANQTAARMLGRSSTAEVVGLSIFDIFHPDFHAVIRERIKELTATGKAQPPLEEKILRADGSTLAVETTAAPITLGGRFAVHVELRDITERKQAEAALASSETRLRLAQDSAQLGIYEYDRQTGAVYFSERLRALWGFTREEPITEEPLIQGILPEDREYVRAALTRAFDPSGKGHYSIEFRVRNRGDGTVRWVAATGKVHFEDGRAVRFLGMGQEITERKRVEEALEAAHQQMQSIIDNTPAVVYAFDLEERFLLVNAALAALLKSTPAAMIGKRRHEFMPKEDADWHEANDRQVIEAGKAIDFEEYSQLHGRSITWLTAKFPLRDAQGKIYAIAGISTDISERKQTERALQESEQKYRDVVTYSRDVIYRYNIQTNVYEFVSEAAEEVTGYPVEEFRRLTREQAARMIHPDDLQAFYAGVRELEERGWADIEYRQQVKSGAFCWLSNRMALVRDAEGRPLYRIGNLRDISARKNAELELARSHQQINHILDSIQDDFYVLDHNWVFVYASRSFTARVGKEPKDFVGNCIWTMFPNHVGTQLEENFRAAMEKGEVRRFEVQGKYTDRTYHMTVFPSPEGITVLGTDITDMKMQEAALRAHVEGLRTLVEAATRPRALVDAKGIIETVNTLAASSLGYRPEEMEGHAIGEFMVPLPKMVQDLYWKDARRHPGKPVTGTIQLRRKGGQAEWVSIEVRPLSPGTTTGKYLVLFEGLEFKEPPRTEFKP